MSADKRKDALRRERAIVALRDLEASGTAATQRTVQQARADGLPGVPTRREITRLFGGFSDYRRAAGLHANLSGPAPTEHDRIVESLQRAARALAPEPLTARAYRRYRRTAAGADCVSHTAIAAQMTFEKARALAGIDIARIERWRHYDEEELWRTLREMVDSFNPNWRPGIPRRKPRVSDYEEWRANIAQNEDVPSTRVLCERLGPWGAISTVATRALHQPLDVDALNADLLIRVDDYRRPRRSDTDDES